MSADVGGPHSPAATVATRRRVLLLGASNLTRHLPLITSLAQGIWREPLDIHAAVGRGRAYHRESKFLGRGVPSIRDCGVWQSLLGAVSAPRAALVTDIGNDLLYEEPVERIEDSLRTCFDKIFFSGATTVVTRLPIENLEGLSPVRFRMLRGLFFPSSRVELKEVRTAARALDKVVERLALERGFLVVRPRAEWYAFDPIHIRHARAGSAWREIIGGWGSAESSVFSRAKMISDGIRMATWKPERRHSRGRWRDAPQPSGHWSNGTTLSLY